jgi:predicted nucleic acid-binding protein
MNAIDTNIWVYSHDKRDEDKQRAAQRLIATLDPMALLWQVGCEFIAAARKLEPFGFRLQDAWNALADMQTIADIVLLPNHETWSIARGLQERLQVHFWDALIIAACNQGGVETFYSEDFGDQTIIDGLRIVNPFVPP